MIKKLLGVLTFYILLLIGNVAFANEMAEVEVIVFEQIQKDNDEKRRYPGDLERNNSIDLFEDAKLPFPNIKILDKSEYKLNEHRNRLARHKNFRILQHLAWEQDFDKYSTKGIYIKPTEIDSILFSEIEAIIKARPYQNNIIVDVDAIAKIGEDEYASRIKSKKVISNKQIYYFDHPDFGVILQVRPKTNS
ncbi:MAG: hypothetical protein HOI53_00065 [Francisellaceae bacterium]|jgi:hypothetical protein|nr:hypothetical protein [Francisellaceae bacterium]MBT6206393.1 hypothetical protein [Francisellaceae bacterium]MBT6538349.1 hypothetical protein [Francisellaceae bacterium]